MRWQAKKRKTLRHKLGKPARLFAALMRSNHQRVVDALTYDQRELPSGVRQGFERLRNAGIAAADFEKLSKAVHDAFPKMAEYQKAMERGSRRTGS